MTRIIYCSKGNDVMSFFFLLFASKTEFPFTGLHMCKKDFSAPTFDHCLLKEPLHLPVKITLSNFFFYLDISHWTRTRTRWAETLLG